MHPRTVALLVSLVLASACATSGEPPIEAPHARPAGPANMLPRPSPTPRLRPDRDGDGAPDDDAPETLAGEPPSAARDMCPDVAEDLDGVADADGCPEEDADRDGIADVADKCPTDPGLPSTAHPEESGCPSFRRDPTAYFEALQFGANDATFSKTNVARLDRIAKILAADPDLSIEIEGHASSDERSPDAMSLARANAVRSVLVARGIAERRMKVVGSGATEPIASDADALGRTQNRRVEIHDITGRAR